MDAVLFSCCAILLCHFRHSATVNFPLWAFNPLVKKQGGSYGPQKNVQGGRVLVTFMLAVLTNENVLCGMELFLFSFYFVTVSSNWDLQAFLKMA